MVQDLIWNKDLKSTMDGDTVYVFVAISQNEAYTLARRWQE